MKKGVSRRTVLKYGAGILGASAVTYLASVLACSQKILSKDAMLEPRVFALINDREQAYRIGSAYLEMRGQVRSLAETTDRIGALREVVSASCGRAAQDRLHAVFQEDFREERTVVADGWVLSETEALICGLWATRLRGAA